MYNSDLEVLKYLISLEGIVLDPKNLNGDTPLDVADSEEKKAVILEAGGKSGREL
jgi:hypothetical protein